MKRKVILGLGLALCLAATSCGTNTGTTSPRAKNGILLVASDVPAFRLGGEDPASDASHFADLLSTHGNCLCPGVLKDDPKTAATKLTAFGFKRGYAELWFGAGVQAGAFAADFDTAAHAKAAVAYMKTEMFRECPGNAFCSRRVEIKRPGIPNFVGQAFTPLRPKEEGPETTLYKFLFQIGSSIYGVLDGATNDYDPGAVSQGQALALVQRLYDRVKNRSITDVLRTAPTSPRGPGAAPPPPDQP